MLLLVFCSVLISVGVGTKLYVRASSVSAKAYQAANAVADIRSLATRKGLFDDPSYQIAKLSAVTYATLTQQEIESNKIIVETGAATTAGAKAAAALSREHIEPPVANRVISKQHSYFWIATGNELSSRISAVARALQAALKTRASSMREQAATRRKLAQPRWQPAFRTDDSPLFAPSVHPDSMGTPNRRSATAGLTGLSRARRRGRAGVGDKHMAMGSSSNRPSELRRRAGAGPGPVGPRGADYDPEAAGGGSSAGGLPQGGSGSHGDGDGGDTMAGAGAGRASARAVAMQQRQAALRDRAAAARGRLSAAEQIEGMVAQMGGMFMRVSQLVSQQEESVARIDEEISEAGMQAKEAQGDLVRFMQAAAGDRSTILGALAAVALVALFFAFVR